MAWTGGEWSVFAVLLCRCMMFFDEMGRETGDISNRGRFESIRCKNSGVGSFHTYNNTMVHCVHVRNT